MKPYKWVIGIDYSMTCPAITIVNREVPFSFESCQLRYLSEKIPKSGFENIVGTRLGAYKSDEERFDKISTWAIETILADTNDGVNIVVFMEDYSYGSKGKVFNIAENTGLLKHLLYKQGIPVNLLAPTQIKKYARGKGVGTKDQMYESFLAETGINLMSVFQPKATLVSSPVGDLVDSFYIAKYGYHEG